MSFARSTWIVAVLIAVLVAGCSSSAPTASEAPAPAPATLMTPDRPLPQTPEPANGFREAVEAGTRTTTGQPGENYWQQEATYDLTARLFPADKRLEGSARITYTNNSPDTLRQLHLELTQNVHKPGVTRGEEMEVTGGVDVQRVAVNEQALSADAQSGPSYETTNTQLVLSPTSALAPGSTATIEVDWQFTIPQAGASGRMGYDGGDLFFLAYWYPIMSVYDDVIGWMDEPFTGTAEFYSDFARYDLTIEAPAGWIVQSTGTLQNPEAVLTDAAQQRRHRAYRSDTPVRIAEPGQSVTQPAENGRLRWQFVAENVRDVAFSATRNGFWEGARTAIGDRDGDGNIDSTRINTFWRASAPKWAEVTRYQQHALTHIANHLDFAYPWPHMTAVEGGGIIGGGMEFPMMTIMGDYNDNTARMLYAVTAHELAHMWVPMVVSTNERRYSWIDEGTTSFNENVARKDRFTDSQSIGSLSLATITASMTGSSSAMARGGTPSASPSATSTGSGTAGSTPRGRWISLWSRSSPAPMGTRKWWCATAAKSRCPPASPSPAQTAPRFSARFPWTCGWKAAPPRASSFLLARRCSA